jgi:hypothetical protein
MTYDLIFFFFIQSPSISPNKTVVIKTMISDKTVFHFQHCDHQFTLVIVVQLPRLPVNVFCFIETWSNVCFRQHHCFLCLVNLDKFIRTMCFSVNSSFICCNVFAGVLFICCGGYVVACFRFIFFSGICPVSGL